MPSPIFIDFSSLSPLATNDVLEYIFKSSHGADDGIWKPHESVLIRRIVELFTKHGLDRLAHVQKAINEWQSGANYKPSDKPIPAPGLMERWTPEELDFVKLYLEALPPSEWSISDHMLSVEFVVQRYLPADQLTSEAEWLATKASLMGKVQANLDKDLTPDQADTVLMALPASPSAAEVDEKLRLSRVEKATMEFGVARAVENVKALADDVRHKMRSVVLRHVQDKTLTGDTSGRSLQGELLDNFGALNRDWRRIAVTEAGECQLQGMIASVKPFSKVKRIEQYSNACAFCKKINDGVYEVVPADHPNKDGKTQVWPGKNNIGRSGSLRKRVDGDLIERTESELWWAPAGTVHPHCRGRWVPVLAARDGDDPEFAAWLSDLLTS